MGYKCGECGDEFEDESDLGIHLISEFVEIMDDDRLKCELCGLTLDPENESDMEMHLMWGENKAIRTGNTKKEWESFMNNPEFDEIRKCIDESNTPQR